MKETAEYIGHKFSYVSDIHRSLENKMKTGVSSTTRPNGIRDNVKLSSDQTFM